MFVTMSRKLLNGCTMPLTGFGTWQLRSPELEPAVRMAVEVGYRHFDGAAIYDNEAELGKVFNQLINVEKVITRDQVTVIMPPVLCISMFPFLYLFIHS